MEADWVQENARNMAQEMAALGGPPRAAERIAALVKSN
jgi:hypothetical protein